MFKFTFDENRAIIRYYNWVGFEEELDSSCAMNKISHWSFIAFKGTTLPIILVPLKTQGTYLNALEQAINRNRKIILLLETIFLTLSKDRQTNKPTQPGQC